MSIEPLPVSNQDRSQRAPAVLAGAVAGDGKPRDEAVRRIFVCYPRVALPFVARFHQQLLSQLRLRSIYYQIFRDNGADEDESIQASQKWKDTIDQALRESICCLVVMVPSLLERPECEREIKLFQELSQDDPSRFIFVVHFVAMTDTLQAAANHGNDVATLLTELQFHDFSEHAFEGDEAKYAQEVDKIAHTIHRQFTARVNVPPQTSGTEKDKTEKREQNVPPLRPLRSLKAGLALAAALVAAIGIVAWLVISRPSPGEVTVNEPTEEQPSKPADVVRQAEVDIIDIVLPVRVFEAPKKDSTESQLLQPGLLTAKSGEIDVIWVIQADGIDWYEISRADGTKRYIRKEEIPVWNAADPNLELILSVEVFPEPTTAAKPAGTLPPNGLSDSMRHGRPARSAMVEQRLWYRAARSKVDVFFPADTNLDRLVQWSPRDGCLQVTAVRGSLLNGTVNGGPVAPFLAGDRFHKDVQASSVRGQQWFRTRLGQGYGYIPGTQATLLPPEKCT